MILPLGQPRLYYGPGMANLGEINEAITAAREAGADQVALLQCASLYPAPAHVMNLRSIPAMQRAFGVPVGLSDHTLGTTAPALAADRAALLAYAQPNRISG